MTQEYRIKKNHHYFKGPKFQLGYVQITLIILFLFLSLLLNPWFSIGAVLSYAILQRMIWNSLRRVSYKAFFFKNCTYKLEENYDQINKLFGVSETFHHWNSARIGWRCVDGENIELFAYCYINKRRLYKKLIKIKPETNVFCEITIDKKDYVFNVLSEDGTGMLCRLPRTDFKLSNIFMYKLYPYFGGDMPSPKFMKIHLQKIGK